MIPKCSICGREMKKVSVPYKRPLGKFFDLEKLQSKQDDLPTCFSWCCNGDTSRYGQRHYPNFAQYTELDANEDVSLYPEWLQNFWLANTGLQSDAPYSDEIYCTHDRIEKWCPECHPVTARR